jgi:HAMP domain-containing protein
MQISKVISRVSSAEPGRYSAKMGIASFASPLSFPQRIEKVSSDPQAKAVVPLTEEEALEQRFKKLAQQWHDETAFLSSITRKVKHPAYEEIIKMAATNKKAVLGLILKELEREPNHWFVALHLIAGKEPEGVSYNCEETVAAWLNWGKSEGLL